MEKKTIKKNDIYTIEIEDLSTDGSGIGKVDGYTRVTINTEDYREKREETLIRLARRVAAQVKSTGRPRTLEAMNPYERRILHSALQNNPYVTTHSEGEEPNRRVVVAPKRGRRPQRPRDKA